MFNYMNSFWSCSTRTNNYKVSWSDDRLLVVHTDDLISSNNLYGVRGPQIAHFRIHFSLCFKASLRATFLLWTTVLIHIERRLLTVTKIFVLRLLALKKRREEDYTRKKFYIVSRDYPFSWTEPKHYLEVLKTTWLGPLGILSTHNSWYKTIGLASLERRRMTGHVSAVE